MEETIPGISELLDHLQGAGVKTCIVYGSAASGRLRSQSDIDIAIAADKEISPETLTRLYLKAAALLHREVDLRDLRRV